MRAQLTVIALASLVLNSSCRLLPVVHVPSGIHPNQLKITFNPGKAGPSGKITPLRYNSRGGARDETNFAGIRYVCCPVHVF